MKMNEKCLPCVVNQVIKIANMVNLDNKEDLYKKFFHYMSQISFDKTTPEMIGEAFGMISRQIGNSDPYHDLKVSYNQLFLRQYNELDKQIDSFEKAVKYAIVGNIIDFNPVAGNVDDDINHYFANIDDLSLTINDTDKLMEDIKQSKTLLYICDNCGEIVLDKLLIKRIKELNSSINIYVGVRGYPVVNDCTKEDALIISMNEFANIIDNGDSSLGTVLHRVSSDFMDVYHKADIIISKGQANFECLSDEDKNIYFLLMTKCAVIADYIGVKEKSLICLSRNRS